MSKPYNPYSQALAEAVCTAERTRLREHELTGLRQPAEDNWQDSHCPGGRTRGAGPRTTLPWLLYCDPWQGHLNLLSVWDQGTTQPAPVEPLSLARSCRVHPGRLAAACSKLLFDSPTGQTGLLLLARCTAAGRAYWFVTRTPKALKGSQELTLASDAACML